MNDRELWNLFCKEKQVTGAKYESWAFAGNPDKQLEVVLKGEKTMTESLYDLYEIEDEKLPEVGNYSVILNSDGEAKCVVKTVNIKIIPFNEITEADAKKSGEGDKSLEYWKRIRKEDFYQELKRSNIRFEDTMKVVLEEFEVVFVC